MSADRDLGLTVPLEAYPYLQLQRGAIADMVDDPGAWLQLYADALYSEFDCIEPYLPASCDAVLDIGSGMGGIDVLLARHFGDQCRVTLLDGVDDAPDMVKHNETFSNRDAARRFLKLNGLEQVDFIDANDAHRRAPRFYDLVVSFKSWCFHYPPERYMDLVKSASIAGQTKIIVDMRGGRRCRDEARSHDWMRTMTAQFRHVALIHDGIKFETHLFEAQ